MASLSVRQLLGQVYDGQIRIPAFQRGFVWDMDRVAYLMDSLYKRYPIGSLLLWRTRNKLTHERKLGPFVLPDRDENFPIDYVLDGQQRITSIFAVFQTEIIAEPLADWLPIYFDFQAQSNAQDSQFVALMSADADPQRYFPMSTIFDSKAYRQATDHLAAPYIVQIDDLSSRFKELQLAVQYFETEERAQVAIVFERVNRLGLELDTLQLLTAWTWSEEFDLQERFKDLREALATSGFSDVGDDANLVLRCTAAVLRSDPSAESLISLNGAEVRTGFPRVENGIKGAIDFLRTQMVVESITNLPYPALIVPLSVFFAEPDGKQVSYAEPTYRALKRWFWRACFSSRYSGQTIRATRSDIEQIIKLKNGESSALGEFNHDVDETFFTGQVFRINSASTKTFVLLLAQHHPRSFISGANVSVGDVLQAYNRSEFHHIFPRKYLIEMSTPDDRINVLANFCFLNRAENNKIGGRSPSSYKSLMPSTHEPILDSALVPHSFFNDDYDAFVSERARLLVQAAQLLMEDGEPGNTNRDRQDHSP